MWRLSYPCPSETGTDRTPPNQGPISRAQPPHSLPWSLHPMHLWRSERMLLFWSERYFHIDCTGWIHSDLHRGIGLRVLVSIWDYTQCPFHQTSIPTLKPPVINPQPPVPTLTSSALETQYSIPNRPYTLDTFVDLKRLDRYKEGSGHSKQSIRRQSEANLILLIPIL